MTHVLFCLMVTAFQPSSAVADVEQALVRQRQAITTAHIEIRTKFFDDNGDVKRDSRRTLWWNEVGDSRQDTYWLKRKDRGAEGYREVRCLAAKEFVFWSGEPLPGNGQIAIHLTKDVTLPLQGDMIPLDPRLLGMVPEDSFNLAVHPLEYVVGRTPRTGTTIEEVSLNGTDAIRVDYINEHNAQVRMWFVPELGGSVARMEAFHVGNEALSKAIMDCEIVKHERSGIWFPSSCSLHRNREGVDQRVEYTTIKVLSINEPLDPKTFTLAGMDLPVGRGMLVKPTDLRGELFWDGKEVVVGTHGPPAPKPWHRWWLGLGSVSLAIISAGSIWWFLRMRNPTAS